VDDDIHDNNNDNLLQQPFIKHIIQSMERCQAIYISEEAVVIKTNNKEE